MSDNDKSVPYKFQGYDIDNHVEKILKKDVNPKIINIKSDLNNQLQLKNIVDSIWYVKLETNQEGLIGEVNDIILFKERFIIFDRKSKSIFIFSLNGKLIETIKDIGKGPGEYSYPLCIGIDDNNNYLMLYDDKQSKVLYYDLDTYDYIDEKRVYFRFLEFSVLDNGNILVHTHRRYNSHLPQIANYELVLVDSAWNVLKKGQSFNRRQQNFAFSARKSFKIVNSKLFYHPPFNDTIFLYDDGFLIPNYVLDYEIESLPEYFDYDITPNDFAKNYISEKSDKIFFIGEFNITSSHLFLELSHKGKNIYHLHNVYNNNSYSGGEIVKNKFNSALFSFPFSNSNDTIIGFIPSYLVQLAKNSLSKRKDLDKLISYETIELIKNTNENDNHILVLYTMQTHF